MAAAADNEEEALDVSQAIEESFVTAVDEVDDAPTDSADAAANDNDEDDDEESKAADDE